jgi:hypothetical protein
MSPDTYRILNYASARDISENHNSYQYASKTLHNLASGEGSSLGFHGEELSHGHTLLGSELVSCLSCAYAASHLSIEIESVSSVHTRND